MRWWPLLLLIPLLACSTEIVGDGSPDPQDCPAPDTETPYVYGQLTSTELGPADGVEAVNPWENAEIHVLTYDAFTTVADNPLNKVGNPMGADQLYLSEKAYNASITTRTTSDSNGCYEARLPSTPAIACLNTYACTVVNETSTQLNGGLNPQVGPRFKGVRGEETYISLYSDTDDLPEDICSIDDFNTSQLTLERAGVQTFDARQQQPFEYREIEAFNASQQEKIRRQVRAIRSDLDSPERIRPDDHCDYGEPCTVKAESRRLMFTFTPPEPCPGTYTLAADCAGTDCSEPKRYLFDLLTTDQQS